MYIVNHWNDAAAYSGEQIGDRLKDSTALHFNRDGSANVNLYSEETALAKKKSSVSITDRILPQKRRVDSLTAQMVELELEYKAGKMSIQDYSLYRDIVSAKRDRATVLLDRAMKVKPIRPETSEDEEESSYASSSTPSDNNGHRESYSSPVVPDIGVGFFAEVVDGLSDGNLFKSFLKSACKVVQKAVQFSQATRNYYNELKAI
jgi:hypothetical protein